MAAFFGDADKDGGREKIPFFDIFLLSSEGGRHIIKALPVFMPKK